MKDEDLRSGMAFKTQDGTFYVVVQDGKTRFAVFYDEDKQRMDWRGITLFGIREERPFYRITTILESCPVDVWSVVWEQRFTREDLKNGMRLVTRNGRELVYFHNQDDPTQSHVCGVGGQRLSYDYITAYKNDLTYPLFPSEDIVEVYKPSFPSHCVPMSECMEAFTLVWRRAVL